MKGERVGERERKKDRKEKRKEEKWREQAVKENQGATKETGGENEGKI